MKKIKRFFNTVLLLAIAYVIINYNTSFFTDTETHLKYLSENYPVLAYNIGSFSKKINAEISKIPTPAEIIARFQNKELPIDPEDIAENIYLQSDTMLNFYPKRNISVSVSDNTLDCYGITNTEKDKYIVYRFLDEYGDVLRQDIDVCDHEGKFRKQLTIPDGAYQFTFFTGDSQYGEYVSRIHDYIFLSQNENGTWQTVTSPVLDSNLAMYEKTKSKRTALADTAEINISDTGIQNLSSEICADSENDYDNALAIHDWVCLNIFYDSDSIEGSKNNAPYIASDVLASKRAVCLGYANLYAALCRSAGIPCNVVTGHALGIDSGESSWDESTIASTEANHAWNEVYIDNRWIIVDTTWDSQNKIDGNVGYKNDDISHLYFDSNIRFFSANHKIYEYLKY